MSVLVNGRICWFDAGSFQKLVIRSIQRKIFEKHVNPVS